MSQIGEWVFAYHLVGNFGQTSEYEVQVNVESGALVIGVNNLGSCFGSTGPMDVNPGTGRPQYG